MNRGERQRFSDSLCFPPDGQLLTVFHLGPRATGDDISPAYAERLLDLGDFFFLITQLWLNMGVPLVIVISSRL